MRGLLLKGALDLVFVASLAVFARHAAFSPYFRGSLDAAGPSAVEGWVIDRADPYKRVEVQLYLDGDFAGSVLADHPRPDVLAEGIAPDERHGFVFRFDPPLTGEREARVYAVTVSAGGSRRTLQQIGRPIRFRSP